MPGQHRRGTPHQDRKREAIMEFLNFVMALSPIIVVLVGILGFRQSAKKSGPGGPYMDAGAGFYLLQYHRCFL